MYQVNDIVFYNLHGVCKISETAEKQIGKEKAQYYVLKPVYDEASTFFVPIKGPLALEKMRPLLSREEILSLASELQEKEVLWVEDDAERKTKYKTALSSGRPEKLADLLKMVQMHQRRQEQNGKRLHITDERFMKEAEKMLCEEAGFVLRLKPEDVPGFIQKEPAPAL